MTEDEIAAALERGKVRVEWSERAGRTCVWIEGTGKLPSYVEFTGIDAVDPVGAMRELLALAIQNAEDVARKETIVKRWVGW